MTNRRKRWLRGLAAAALAGIAGAWWAASTLSRRFEPYIRQQAIDYLGKRFDSEVELAALRVGLPHGSPLRLLLTRGRGGVARVEGEGIVLRHKGRRDLPPMFAMKKFSFDVDLGTLFENEKKVKQVSLDGMEIHVPPKGERPALGAGGARAGARPAAGGAEAAAGPPPAVLIEKVSIDNARLVIHPKDRNKLPLRFEIDHLRLYSAGAGRAMKYDAGLTNARPPGRIHSTGVFGPWAAAEPGDTPLAGEYRFEDADLGVFAGIAGILKSTGRFTGTLASIDATGEAVVPDFRLKRAGSRVPLATQFQVQVDGTNGNTILKPVHATLGSTRFTTSGGVIKHESDTRRTVSLEVTMPDGDVRDLLRLATKGEPFMTGRIFLKTSIDIPPLSGKVREKLMLDGRFEVLEGKFLKSTIQDQIDQLSRRGQGAPRNEGIDEVLSAMSGEFRLENEVLRFRSLAFGVPGAHVDLAGSYNLDGDALDMRGSLRLAAKVSQTMSGWKRWALKPVDPFFSKRGAGTFLRIRVAGSSRRPQFGLDRGGASADRAK